MDEKVCTKTTYFKVCRPSTVTAKGLLEVLEHALQMLGIPAITFESCNKLVGLGTDGASANVAARGLKGLVEDKVDWIFWMWCLAHRIELALKFMEYCRLYTFSIHNKIHLIVLWNAIMASTCKQ